MVARDSRRRLAQAACRRHPEPAEAVCTSHPSIQLVDWRPALLLGLPLFVLGVLVPWRWHRGRHLRHRLQRSRRHVQQQARTYFYLGPAVKFTTQTIRPCLEKYNPLKRRADDLRADGRRGDGAGGHVSHSGHPHRCTPPRHSSRSILSSPIVSKRSWRGTTRSSLAESRP